MSWCYVFIDQNIPVYIMKTTTNGIYFEVWKMHLSSVNQICDGTTPGIINFKHIIQKSSWSFRCGINLWWRPQNFINEETTLAQVMPWCRQATSYCLSHSWPRSKLLYGVTRPQCVKDILVSKILLKASCCRYCSNANSWAPRFPISDWIYLQQQFMKTVSETILEFAWQSIYD